MSRTTVELMTPACCKSRLLTYLQKIDITPDLEEDQDNDFFYCSFDEIRGGDLSNDHGPIYQDLAALEIPCDISWTAEYDILPGCYCIRLLPEGGAVANDYLDEQINPDIEDLLAAINDYEMLKAVIINHRNKYYHPTWDGQADLAKKASLKYLITQGA